MERIFRVISGLWEVKDIRDRILFTLIVIFFYRVGTHIPIPGVNASALAEYFRVALQNTSFGMFDIFAGGALSRGGYAHTHTRRKCIRSGGILQGSPPEYIFWDV